MQQSCQLQHPVSFAWEQANALLNLQVGAMPLHPPQLPPPAMPPQAAIPPSIPSLNFQAPSACPPNKFGQPNLTTSLDAFNTGIQFACKPPSLQPKPTAPPSYRPDRPLFPIDLMPSQLTVNTLAFTPQETQ